MQDAIGWVVARQVLTIRWSGGVVAMDRPQPAHVRVNMRGTRDACGVGRSIPKATRPPGDWGGGSETSGK